MNSDRIGAKALLQALYADPPEGSLLEIRAIGGSAGASQAFFSANANGLAGTVAHAAELDGRANVYYGVCPRGRNEGTAQAITHARALWVDDPEHPLPDGFPEPSVTVETSPGKVQLIWFLDTWTTELDKVEAINARLRDLTGGDHVQDRARVLRLPGFLNIKPEHPHKPRARLAALHPDRRYSLDDIDAALLAVTPVELSNNGHRTAVPLPGKIIENRNVRLTSAAGSMRRRGMGQAAILAALEVENQDRCDPPLPYSELIEIAASIARYEPQAQAPSVEVPGYRAVVQPGVAGHGTFHGESRICGEALVLVERLEADDQAEGVSVRVVPESQNARTVFVPASVVVSRNPAEALYEATGYAWTPLQAKEVRDWAAIALRAPGVPVVQGLRRPRWEDGKLLLPGPELRLIPGPGLGSLTAYGRTRGNEGDARTAWAEIIAIAQNNPKLAVTLGAALASLYLAQCRRPVCILHLWGDSRLGKTSAIVAAMSAVGDPEGLTRSWNTTRTAATARLEAANILPVALDETGAAGTRDEVLEAVVFGAASGVSRGRGRASGGLREESRWALSLLSSGERRLTTASGLSGVRARVLEVQAPITPDRQSIERVVHLATSFYGWPLLWLAADPQLEALQGDLAALTAQIVEEDGDSMRRTIAGLVALCVAGFLALGRAVGADTLLDVAAQIARTVAEDSMGQLEADGVSAADRLHDALCERVARRPWAYAAGKKGVNDGRDREGVRLEGGWVAFLKSAVKDVAKEINMPDCQPALAGMATDGRLLPGEGRHLGRKVRLEGGMPRLYVVRSDVPIDDPGGNGVGTPVGTSYSEASVPTVPTESLAQTSEDAQSTAKYGGNAKNATPDLALKECSHRGGNTQAVMPL